MLTRILDKILPASRQKSAPAPARQDPPKWKAGDTIIDRYLVDKVFSGAMGHVYIAEHLGWQIPVAIKSPKATVLADKEGAKRIFNEADSWVRMGMHPNVATCYYVLSIEGVPYIFIEFVDGGDLSSWIKTGRCKDLRTSLSLAVQFCHGMEFTHSKGIIHRDIKPQNILINKNSLLKITDFGISQSTNSRSNDSGKLPNTSPQDEQTIGFRGTPGYASPEQFVDTHTVDKRSDIFSFGICMWLMFCGKKPYTDNSVKQDAQPSPPRGKDAFPPVLIEILKKSVAYDPNERYQDFAALRLDLNQAYIDLFKVDCPFIELDFADLQAESYNNRAVSFLELGKIKEGWNYLSKSLDINDALPEAIYNFTLFKWQHNTTKASYIYRQIEAARQRLPDAKILNALSISVKCDMLGSAWDDDSSPADSNPQKSKNFYPEYMLCVPQNSVDVFRESQLHRAAQKNVSDLVANKKYESGSEILFKSWQNIDFRKDKIFIKAYEDLLKVGSKGAIKTVIRLITIPGNGATAKGLTYLPGTRKILSLSRSGKVAIRHYGSKKKISVLEKYKSITAMGVSRNGDYLALASQGGKIHVLSMKTGEETNTFSFKGRVNSLAFSPDNLFLTSGCTLGRIQTNELKTGQTELAVANEGGSITAITYFNKNLDFVSGSEDGTLRYWSAGGSECVRIIEAHALPVTTLSPSANGLFFISCAADRNVKIWDRQTGQCMKSIEAHDDVISSTLMMGDNKHFISGSEDDILKIWTTNGVCSQTLDGRGDGICSLAPGPKPHIFLAGRKDGAVVAWMVVYDLEFN